MNILLTNIGRRVYFVKYILDLKKKYKNLKLYLADNNLNASAFSYKETFKYKIPKISEGENKYIKAIYKIVNNKKINLIIPVTNYDLNILSLYKKKFKLKNCDILISDNKLIKKLLDKELCYSFCKKNNILVPKIYKKFNEIKNKKKLYIKKFKYGNASVGNALLQKIRREDFNKKNYLIQDFIHGKELHFDILNDFKGNYLSSCVKEKIKMRYGETDEAKVLDNKNFIYLAKKISKIFKHVGNLDCDAIIDKSGNVNFLDFNPRFGGGYPFTHLSGFNFIKAILDLIKKNKIYFPNSPKKIVAAKGISINLIKRC